MYGGPGKLGRGGGGAGGGGRGAGGAVKRNVNSTFHPSPLPRPSPTPGGRLSSAGPRNSSTAPGPTTSSSAAEENFSLVTGNPLNFAMIIRLTPDLVDEIKRAESQGCTTRIRFDANANNTSGNVIDVGGKDFRFTWSREMGDLCDIYEERRSGEDGNGMLVESGCAWRKLNVQRVLDESTKNHVKMRSEEAERKFKSRKAIVLEHGNPSMKSQVKALAAAEVNPWTRMPFKQKKEPQPPFKKRKAEPPPGGPPKSVHKSGFSSTTPSKGRPSPLPSTPEQSGAPASPFGTGKSHAIVEDVMPTQAMSKEITTVSEKEVPNRVITSAVRDKPGRKGNLGAQPTDLRSLLISLLMENPKGMSLKALEKAIGDSIPNSARQIEPIIKKIATFQAPGRYFLKPGVELESFKKPSSESGSSPEDNRHQTLTADDNTDQVPVPEPIISVKAHRKELDEQTQLNSKPGEVSNASEKNDIPHHSPDLLGETKVANNSEGPAGSSSDSGSDSDSDGDSSDSGSDSGSHSRSKSRSPVRSGSGSSSDSESDASSNSKEASDEDVDIMTSDDDKESKNKLQASELGLFTSPIPWRTDGGPVQNGIDEKRDGLGSDIVEIVENLFGNDQEAEMTVVTNSDPNKKGEKPAEETKPPSSDQQDSLVYTGNLDSERENMANDGYKHVQSDSFERKSKGKSKRGSDGKHFDDNSERSKRLKSGNLTQPQMSGGRNSHLSLSPHNLSPRSIEGPHKGPTIRTTNTAVSDETDFGSLRGYNQLIPGKSISDSQPSGRRSIDLSALPKPPAAVERPVKYGDVKYSERNLQTHEGFPTQKDKVNRETQGEDGYTNEQKHPKNSKEGGVGDKHSTPVDSHYRKHGELAGKFEVGSLLNSHMEYPVINGRGSILKRELSDLELGELREPMPDETPGVKKQFDRKSSFKQLENRPTSSDYWNSDLRKGKPAGKLSVDIIKQSLPNSSIGIPSNLEGLSKKRTPEHNVEELARPNHRVVQSQPQQLLRVDHTEGGPQFNKLADANCKSRLNEAGERLGIGLEGYGDAHKKVSVSAEQQHGNKRGLVPNSIKESKKQKSNTLIDSSNKQNDTLTERDDGRQKRRESSSDENNCSYYKYEKEEPELKGPIKDFSQYKEYVQEYREKYDSYCSLNKILESYRNDFNKLGRDLEIAKGKDMDRYHNLMGQLKESYRQCGTKHKRLKKIFVVLHEELKCLKEMIKDYAVPYKKE